MPGICFVPDQDVFVFLTQQRPRAQVRPCEGSFDIDPASLNSISLKPFSRCGHVFVSFNKLPGATPACNITTDSTAMPTQIPTSSWQLCHTEVGLRHSSCPRQCVAASSGWLPSSLVWHPNAAACTYAVLNFEHSIFLMDGLVHKCIRCWTVEQLSAEFHGSTAQAFKPERLFWHPSGTCLVAAVKQALLFLYF